MFLGQLLISCRRGQLSFCPLVHIKVCICDPQYTPASTVGNEQQEGSVFVFMYLCYL